MFVFLLRDLVSVGLDNRVTMPVATGNTAKPYAFDLLHLDGRDVSALPFIERKVLLEPLIGRRQARPSIQWPARTTAGAASSSLEARRHARF